jgi:hypothetical protein
MVLIMILIIGLVAALAEEWRATRAELALRRRPSRRLAPAPSPLLRPPPLARLES